MLFSSATFLFMFLPAVILGYYVCPHKFRNIFLLIGSIVFYAWGEPKYLLVMFITILLNYIGALLIARSTEYKKLYLAATVISNLGFLFYFKYLNFVIENLNLLFNSHLAIAEIILPLGISFYTFQALSYTIDVYYQHVQPQRNLLKLALYICLFPQLIAGPIVKYHDIEDQIDHRQETFESFYYGLRRFIIGLAKKLIIANTVGAVADKIFALPVAEYDMLTAWLGAIAYGLQLYYDFSGYSDMAIGLGAMFGFKFMENFNYPFISKSVSEYWRRWHISLGTWFKDYLYIPLGGNRGGTWHKYLNIMIVFACVGTWHGATWAFVFSGLYNGAMIVFENIIGMPKAQYGIIGKILQRIYAFIAMLTGLIFFRSETLSYTGNLILNMMGLIEHQNIIYKTSYYFDATAITVMCVAILCATPLFKNILNVDRKHTAVNTMINLWLLVLFGISCIELAANTYNPFIYFRF